MAITVLSGFDDVATDYVVVASTDGKGNTSVGRSFDHSGEARHDHLRPPSDTSNRSHPARPAPVTNFASSRTAASLRRRDKRFGFGILGSDGRCTVQK